eukprot:3671082-Prymnesium_polylepis.1
MTTLEMLRNISVACVTYVLRMFWAVEADTIDHEGGRLPIPSGRHGRQHSGDRQPPPQRGACPSRKNENVFVCERYR